MSNTDLVRASRDGDQFHYLWAARRCLKLLLPGSDLRIVTIEGASTGETAPGQAIEAGEEIIDVGEYYGSERLAAASRVRYVQLKHSTFRVDEAWTMSGLAGTLQGFAARFAELQKLLGPTGISKIDFVFATNRPVSTDVTNAIEDAAKRQPCRDAQASRGLEKYTNLSPDALAIFCSLLRVEGEHQGFLAQRSALENDLRGYLPETDQESLLLLQHLVTRKATTEFSSNPSITRLDVLRVLGVEPSDLYPAENKIEIPVLVIPREQEQALVKSIIDAGTRPVIVHADGGVGKSIFASRIGAHLPKGSVCVVYDCFGNGEYRTPSNPRHKPRQALVQTANELAGQMYCQPLIPSGRADDPQYFRAFTHRLRQAVATVRRTCPESLVCLVFDAADNAEMAASEADDGPSFAKRLLREAVPDGVRLVMLCRTHRRELLTPPPGIVQLELGAFSLHETAAKLRSVFAEANQHDVAEFHRLSSRNPRVQSTALRTSQTLVEVLRNLGPEPKTVDEMIGRLLQLAVHRARDEVPASQHPLFDRICTGLAVLRPMVPLEVLASVSNTEAASVRSFLSDLGQEILLKGSLVQFRDEPTETWFQQQFRPNSQSLVAFIAALRPQAASSTYVAAALPHLMLGAGMIDELIEIALASTDLPAADTIGRRDIETQRLHFALRASIKADRNLEATKLALKAAGLAATGDRQLETLQHNTDLAGRFLEPTQVLDLVSRRSFSSHWRGSHHAYDAALFSHRSEFHADARSHLRMAHEWLRNLFLLPEAERDGERIEADDIAEIGLAHLNVHGVERAAEIVRNCLQATFRYEVARRIGQRLADAGRLVDIDALANAGRADAVLIAALAEVVGAAGHLLPREPVERTWRVVRRLPSQDGKHFSGLRDQTVDALAALALAAHKHGLQLTAAIGATCQRHLGTDRLRMLSSRHTDSRPSLVGAYVLSSTLAGQRATLETLAPPDIRAALAKGGRTGDDSDAREFRARVGALLPWYQLWADVCVSPLAAEELAARLAQAQRESDSAQAIVYWEVETLKNEVLLAQASLLEAAGPLAAPHLAWLRERGLDKSTFTGTLIRLSGACARNAHLNALSLEFAAKAARQLAEQRTEAAEKADSYVALSRALLPLHNAEAKLHFQQALDVASKIGDENLARWQSVVLLAQAAADPARPSPERAYRLARAAELTYEFVYRDKHFDWEATVEAIARVCPISAIAILSRWRDRNFGNCQRLLPVLVDHLLQAQLLNPKVAAALYCFQADWSLETFLTAVLSRTDAGPERNEVAALLWNYIRLDLHSPRVWRKLLKLAQEFGVNFPEAEQFADQAERREERAKKRSDDHRTLVQAPQQEVNWNAVFDGLKPHSLSDLAQAQKRCELTAKYGAKSQVFVRAAHRVAVGHEHEFFEALTDFPGFELYELQQLLEDLPAPWAHQQSTMEALRSLVRELAARHCFRITVRTAYQLLPLDVVERACGLPRAQVIGAAVHAIADVADPLGAESLFNLVGLLSTRLDARDGASALDYELTRMEEAMSDADGDGPWHDAFAPGGDLSSAVASYVWAGLAAPEASYRWQGAHVVRALCRLRCDVCIDTLTSCLAGTIARPFVDSRLVHYELHAQQWLLIGLARAAIERPDSVAKHVPQLVGLALQPSSHALIRYFAASAVLAAHHHANVVLEESIVNRLRGVNQEKIDRTQGPRDRWHQEELTGPRRPIELHFGIDMPHYWFDRLGGIFGLNETDMCERVEKVILHDWSVPVETWDHDQRTRKRIIDGEETRHSHGTYPRADDLHFYYSYHAMFAVAGQLVDEIQLRAVEDEWHTFENWLHGHSLTRKDGGWLADRRDPEPFEEVDWSEIKDNQEWKWCVSRDDFDRVLFQGPQAVVVAGHWVVSHEPRREEVDVSSALVTPETALSLLRSRQCSADIDRDPPLPSAGSDNELEDEGFVLKGWIVDNSSEAELDQFDPWAADIRYPPLCPAKFVEEQLSLQQDDEQRAWRIAGIGVVELSSRTWAQPPAGRREDKEPSRGRRLEASKDLIQQLLVSTGMKLLVEVSIRRRLASSYESKDDDDAVGYPPPYAKYFLFDADGTITTV